MPVRNRSDSFCASTLSFLLPSFNRAFRRGLQTSTSCTCGFSRSYSQAAQVPSSQVTCSSPRRPWINCRRLVALVSTMDSIASLPPSLRTAITIASLCTSIPIYLTSRLILSCLLGGKITRRPTESFPQGTVPRFPESSYSYLYPDVLPTFCPCGAITHSRRRSGAKPCTAQRSGGGASPSASTSSSRALFHNALTQSGFRLERSDFDSRRFQASKSRRSGKGLRNPLHEMQPGAVIFSHLFGGQSFVA